VLSRGVTAFQDHQHTSIRGDEIALQLHQLDLQFVERLLVVLVLLRRVHHTLSHGTIPVSIRRARIAKAARRTSSLSGDTASPSAITRPASITTIWSQYRDASDRSCKVTMTAIPRSASARSNSMRRSWWAGSRCAAGSSAISTGA